MKASPPSAKGAGPAVLFRLAVVLVSCGMFWLDWLARVGRRLRGRPVAGTCVFVTYHSIEDETRGNFARQMVLLKRLARPLSRPETRVLENGVHHVGVTFDDAFRSFANNALPVVVAAKVPVILFVPTGWLGRPSGWYDYGNENPVGEEVLTADEIKRLAEQHQIEIGSHTVSHPNLVEISQDEAVAELRDSRQTLETMLGRKINSLSFPYGSFAGRELKLARETAGYDFCFSTDPRMLSGSIQPGLVGRVSVQPTDWDIEFKLKILGACRWMSWASAVKKKVKRWLRRGPGIKEANAYG